MQYLVRVFIISILTACSSYTTENAVPPARVNKTFKEKYKDAQEKNWEKTKNDRFLVTFKLGKQRNKALFSRKGEWIETKKTINSTQLPKDIKERFDKSKFRKWSLDYIYRIITPKNQDEYELGIKKGKEKSNKIRYNEQGKRISK